MSREPRLIIMDERAYVERLLAIVVEPWYMQFLGIVPRAYFDGTDVVVLKGHETNQKLLAHEYGHYLGFDHPPFPLYFIDMMGYGLRITDIHEVMERSEEWRERNARRA